ncbi:MAG: hypothetical protein A2W19_05605 [Spirochaetes bacterium RBG_16_49_21]|nr:MAG: hypothetical protein A2W19_05605 [Spirochaetes bacterium RBG_16_49_21]
MKKKSIAFILIFLASLFSNCSSCSCKSGRNKSFLLLLGSNGSTSEVGTSPGEESDTSTGEDLWARSVSPPGSNNSEFKSVSAGSDGIYAAGYIMGTGVYNFGGPTAQGTCSLNNVVLVKYDTNGEAQWARSVLSGSSTSVFNSVSVGSEGVYAVGSIYGTGEYKFGEKTVNVDSDGYNAVLVKYNTNGEVQWVSSVSPGSKSSLFHCVSVGSDGIYAAGYIVGKDLYSFGTQSVSGASDNYNAVLVKYDTDGNTVWAKSVSDGPASGLSRFYSVSAGNDGIYVAGYILGIDEYKFGDKSVNGAFGGGDNAVLVKYDTNGVAQWAKSVSAGSGPSKFNSVSVRSGGIYAAGYIFGIDEYKFGDKSVNGAFGGDDNAVLVKYDTNGVAQWAKSVSAGSGPSEFNSVSVRSGGIYASGYIVGIGPYTFGTQTVNAINAINTCSNVVLVKYDISGNSLWARSVSDATKDSEFYSSSAGSSGIYAAGYINDTGNYTFGTQTANGAHSFYNVVLVKYK